MAELMDIIKGRRSIRRYQDKEVPAAALNTVLEAVQWSPSWANTQCWEIVVVRDKAVKEKLQTSLPGINPAIKAMVEAPVVLVVCGRLQASGYYKGQVTTKFGDWFMFDLGIATQSICLVAYSLGLGTVVVGLFDHSKAREAVGLPDGYELVAMIPIGYPAKDSPVLKRRDIKEFTHNDKF